MKRNNSAAMTFFLFALCILWSCFVISSPDAAEKAAMGVVVIAHGAPIPQWNDTVMKVVASVKSPCPVEPGFMDFDEERTLAKAVKRLEGKGVNEVLVVHVSPSSYSSHHEELFYLTGLRKNLGPYETAADKPIHSTLIKRFAISPAMDDHPLTVTIVKDYARELSQNPVQESLMLVGHGPVEELENIMWVRQMEKIGQEIQKTMPFKEVACMTLRADAPDLIREQAHEDARKTALRLSTQGRVIVVICGIGIKMLQFELQHLLKGIPSVVINQKGFINHPNTVKWIEETIKNGMNQHAPAPINRKWTVIDHENGQPPGTHRYGLL